MNRKNIFQRFLFRKDFFWKVKEKLFWFIRNNSRNAFKDQRILLKNLESGIILDVGANVGDTTEMYLHPGLNQCTPHEGPQPCKDIPNRALGNAPSSLAEAPNSFGKDCLLNATLI
mgnify:CR=1 FL=1